MRLIFIRHAEPDYEHNSLTEKGFREAAILAERTKHWKPDRVFISPMGRAQLTAAPSLKNWKLEGTTYDWLQEFYYRIKDPVTGEERIAWDFYPEYFTKEKLLHDKDEWYKTPVMESGNLGKYYDDVKTGLDGILKEYGYISQKDGLYKVEKHSDDTIVFFCHLGVSFAMIGYLTGIAAPALWQGFFVAPTSIMVLCSDERKPDYAAFRVQTLGDVSHLQISGEEISGSGYFSPMFQQ